MSDIVDDQDDLTIAYMVGFEKAKDAAATEITTLRAELAAAKERAEKAEVERDEHAGFCAEAIEQRTDAEVRALAAEAKAEGLAKALEETRDAITHEVNRLSIACTVWMPTGNETMSDFIDRALTAYRTDKENDDG
jgi:hypothetical protein